jgi:hypothetical protein
VAKIKRWILVIRILIFSLPYAIQKLSTGAELFILNRLICKKHIEIQPTRFIGRGGSLPLHFGINSS